VCGGGKKPWEKKKRIDINSYQIWGGGSRKNSYVRPNRHQRIQRGKTTKLFPTPGGGERHHGKIGGERARRRTLQLEPVEENGGQDSANLSKRKGTRQHLKKKRENMGEVEIEKDGLLGGPG